MTGCSFVSRKWPEEAFGDRAVVRCFVGAAGAAEEGVDRADADLVASASRRLSELVGLPPDPEDARVVRWPRSMPQYEVGHLDLVDEVERSLPPGVFVTGQGYRGVGVPDCVRDAGRVAERVRERAA
jgi:oxygen-dependent protoporphyrinogen oxidase